MYPIIKISRCACENQCRLWNHFAAYIWGNKGENKWLNATSFSQEGNWQH